MKRFSAKTGRYLSFPCGTPCFHTPQTFCACLPISKARGNSTERPQAFRSTQRCRSTLPGDNTSWETGCGRLQSRQRNPGFCSGFEAPQGPCVSPPRPGVGTPPPSAGEGGLARAWHSAFSCQWSSTSYCPPSRGRTPSWVRAGGGRRRAYPSGLCSSLLREAPNHEEKQVTVLHKPQGKRDTTTPVYPPQPQTPVKKPWFCNTDSIQQLTQAQQQLGIRRKLGCLRSSPVGSKGPL